LTSQGSGRRVGDEEIGDLGEAVEPINEVFAGLTVFEAVVEFFAEGSWETADFSGAGHNGGFWFAKTMQLVFFGKCRFGFSWRFVVLSTSARGISCP
jgi:hypothetical protein